MVRTARSTMEHPAERSVQTVADLDDAPDIKPFRRKLSVKVSRRQYSMLTKIANNLVLPGKRHGGAAGNLSAVVRNALARVYPELGLELVGIDEAA